MAGARFLRTLFIALGLCFACAAAYTQEPSQDAQENQSVELLKLLGDLRSQMFGWTKSIDLQRTFFTRKADALSSH